MIWQIWIDNIIRNVLCIVMAIVQQPDWLQDWSGREELLEAGESNEVVSDDSGENVEQLMNSIVTSVNVTLGVTSHSCVT